MKMKTEIQGTYIELHKYLSWISAVVTVAHRIQSHMVHFILGQKYSRF